MEGRRRAKERIFKTNKNETQILLDILGICGVLSSEEFPCYCEQFVNSFDRAPVEDKNDFYYPRKQMAQKRRNKHGKIFKSIRVELLIAEIKV